MLHRDVLINNRATVGGEPSRRLTRRVGVWRRLFSPGRSGSLVLRFFFASTFTGLTEICCCCCCCSASDLNRSYRVFTGFSGFGAGFDEAGHVTAIEVVFTGVRLVSELFCFLLLLHLRFFLGGGGSILFFLPALRCRSAGDLRKWKVSPLTYFSSFSGSNRV